MIPTIWGFPVKRPGFIYEANWLGDDASLALQCKYYKEGGVGDAIEFPTRNIADSQTGEVCLPTSNDLNDLSGSRTRDLLIAHTRMACMVAGLAIPGSKEFSDAFTQNDSNNLQTALGTVKVTNVGPVTDQVVTLTFKQGTGPNYLIDADHGELNRYTFAPSTQLLVIPGSIKKQFPTYVHDYPTHVLTQAQKDAIIAYILGLALWV